MTDRKSGPNRELPKRTDFGNIIPESKREKTRFRLSSAQLTDLNTAFKWFGAHNAGNISPSDLRVALRCIGYSLNNRQLDELVGLISTDHDTTISFNDFVYLMTYVMGGQDSRSDLRKAFQFFPKERNGEISFETLKIINTSLGENLNDEELHEMIEAADKNKNGTVSEEEFLNICHGVVLWDWK